MPWDYSDDISQRSAACLRLSETRARSLSSSQASASITPLVLLAAGRWRDARRDTSEAAGGLSRLPLSHEALPRSPVAAPIA